MLSASDKQRYIKRLIFLVSLAEQAGYTDLLETPKTDVLALQPINKKNKKKNDFHMFLLLQFLGFAFIFLSSDVFSEFKFGLSMKKKTNIKSKNENVNEDIHERY